MATVLVAPKRWLGCAAPPHSKTLARSPGAVGDRTSSIRRLKAAPHGCSVASSFEVAETFREGGAGAVEVHADGDCIGLQNRGGFLQGKAFGVEQPERLVEFRFQFAGVHPDGIGLACI